MKRFSILLTLLMLVALAFGGVVNAQDDMGVDPCFGLSAEDCGAINEASAALLSQIGSASSFTIGFSIDFDASGIPDFPPVTLDTSGAIDIVEGDMNMQIPVNMGGMVDVAFTGMENLDSTTVEFRLVDQNFYFLVPMMEGWQALDLATAMEDPSFTEGLPFDPTNPDAAAGFLTESMGELPEIDPASLFALMEIINLDGLISYTRDGDVYTFVVDLTALENLSEEQLNNIITIASEIDPSLAFMIPALPQLLETGTITITQDISQGYVSSMGFDIDATVALGAMMGDPSMEPINVTLRSVTTFNNIDGAAAPEAPADATFLDPNTGMPVDAMDG